MCNFVAKQRLLVFCNLHELVAKKNGQGGLLLCVFI